jgi:hypothetical protein
MLTAAPYGFSGGRPRYQGGFEIPPAFNYLAYSGVPRSEVKNPINKNKRKGSQESTLRILELAPSKKGRIESEWEVPIFPYAPLFPHRRLLWRKTPSFFALNSVPPSPILPLSNFILLSKIKKKMAMHP